MLHQTGNSPDADCNVPGASTFATTRLLQKANHTAAPPAHVTLPPPFAYLIDDEPMAWRYPFHLMRPGEAIFVTDARDLSIRAERAARIYCRYLLAVHGINRPLRIMRRDVCGIWGVVIARRA